MEEKLAIFIDGSNLHGCLSRVTQVHREAKKLHNDEFYFIDFDKLLKYLNPDKKKLAKVYYARSVTESELNNKKDFFHTLDYLGYKLDIKVRKDAGKEKGVDMAIAMEMLICAYNNFYDEAIIVASDADYCQLVREVQRLGKRVGIASFGLSFGLSAELLNEKDFYIDLLKGDILTKEKAKKP